MQHQREMKKWGLEWMQQVLARMSDGKIILFGIMGGQVTSIVILLFDKEKQVGVVILSNLSPSYRIPATVMGVKLIKSLQGEV